MMQLRTGATRSRSSGARGLTRRGVLGAGAAAGGVAALAGALVEGGCGTPGSSGQAAPAGKASGTVRYLTWGDATSDAIEKKVMDAFQQRNDKIKIEFAGGSSSDHFTRLTAMLAGGDPPDTALVDGYDIRALIKRGGAQDVTARMQRDGIKKDDYVPEWFDEFLYKGKYHYHPNLRGSTQSVYFNKSLIEKMGAKVPAEGWSLTDWLDLAQKTTRDASGSVPTSAAFDPSKATFGAARPSQWWPFLWVNGGDLIDLDKNVCVIDSPNSIESLQFLADMVNKQKVTRNSFSGVPGEADLFEQGRLATYVSWFTNIPRFRSNISSFEWDTTVQPQGKVKKQIGLYKGNGEVLLTGAKNPDAAWEFMKFLGSYDGMIIYGVEGRFVPALKKANQDPQYLSTGKPPKNLASFSDARVRTLPLMPEWNDFNREIWTPNLNKIWSGEALAKDVAPEIARQTTELYLKNREKY